MKSVMSLVLGMAGLGLLQACSTSYDPLEEFEEVDPATILEAPEAAASAYPREQVERGQYLVGLLGCGSCHTDGALLGLPRSDRLLAGSGVGIAYSNPLSTRNPGIVYPANLTPDPETGIGAWSEADIVAMLQRGFDKHSGQTLPVMPWPAYAGIHEDDAYAVAAYLKSLPPVRHVVPANVLPGQRASAPFVHFGVYQSRDQ